MANKKIRRIYDNDAPIVSFEPACDKRGGATRIKIDGEIEFDITSWPPPTKGMGGSIIKQGVKVQHIASGKFKICEIYQSQHENKAFALAELKKQIE